LAKEKNNQNWIILKLVKGEEVGLRVGDQFLLFKLGYFLRDNPY